MTFLLSMPAQEHVLAGGQPIDRNTRYGMFALVLVSFTSILCTSGILIFIVFRTWPRQVNFRLSAAQRSCLVVVTQLILADLIQSLGFFMSISWLPNNVILDYSPLCYVQGFTINLGDMSSAFFVLYMATQTLIQLKYRRTLDKKNQAILVVAVWVFSLLLSVLGPAVYDHYFVPTGAWCWAAPWFIGGRMLFHYAWIFMVEFTSIVIYGLVVFELRKLDKRLQVATRGIYISTHSGALLKQHCAMAIVYPVAYTILTLPLAVCRMVAFNQNIHVPAIAMCAVGIIITSCGWVDSILYVLGRKSLFRNLTAPQDSVRELTTRRRNQSSGRVHSVDTRKSSRVSVRTTK